MCSTNAERLCYFFHFKKAFCYNAFINYTFEVSILLPNLIKLVLHCVFLSLPGFTCVSSWNIALEYMAFVQWYNTVLHIAAAWIAPSPGSEQLEPRSSMVDSSRIADAFCLTHASVSLLHRTLTNFPSYSIQRRSCVVCVHTDELILWSLEILFANIFFS